MPSIFVESKDEEIVLCDDANANEIGYANSNNIDGTLCNRCENEIECLKQINRTQSLEIQTLREELNKFKQSRLAVFCQNANSAKVRLFILIYLSSNNLVNVSDLCAYQYCNPI